MHKKLSWLWRIGLLLILFVSVAPPAYGQTDPARTLYDAINQARLNEGLAPLGWSRLLTQAAQRHANDMATHYLIQSEGSDGSTYRQRIRDTGYRAWNDGLIVYETLWAGLGNAENAFNWYQNHPNEWEKFFDERFREIGVGYATDDQGVNYFVLTLGSRPNVLPIFINDGAETATSPQVSVRLTNENTEPLGEGTWIGQAIEVRLSGSPEFDSEPWQPWSALLPWMLQATESGEYAVYVQYRDGAGRTTVSEDTIRLELNGAELPQPTPEITLPPTPQPEITPDVAEATPIPSEIGETLPTPESVPTVTPLAPVEAPLVSPEPLPTWTPLPFDTTLQGEPSTTDWPLLIILLLQGCAWLLGIALFLRRR